ncbi:MAG: hypothetical protein MR051_02415, partial [Lentisphaeria bacterium]|nr:hypothetical protein [Lentisphaeria bacterium]
VLAGVSGTGKSELPRLYSHFGGLFFEPLSVQPNWDSQESMLGFFNSIDNKFDAQPVLRFLAQSQKDWTDEYPGLKDAPPFCKSTPHSGSFFIMASFEVLAKSRCFLRRFWEKSPRTCGVTQPAGCALRRFAPCRIPLSPPFCKSTPHSGSFFYYGLYCQRRFARLVKIGLHSVVCKVDCKKCAPVYSRPRYRPNSAGPAGRRSYPQWIGRDIHGSLRHRPAPERC